MIHRKDIRPAIRAALMAADPFAGRSIACVLDDSSTTSTQAMEEQLRSRGMVLVVTPILGSSLRDPAKGRVLERAVVAVHVRANPAVNAMATGAQIAPEDAVDAVITTLIALGQPDAVLDGLEPGDGERLTELVPEDSGLLTTAVFASARLSLS